MTNPIEVTEAVARAGKILPHSLSDETALEYEKRALTALRDYLAMQQASPKLKLSAFKGWAFTDHFAGAGNMIEQIEKLLANDPICNGRVAHGTVEAIAALVGVGDVREIVAELRAQVTSTLDGNLIPHPVCIRAAAILDSLGDAKA